MWYEVWRDKKKEREKEKKLIFQSLKNINSFENFFFVCNVEDQTDGNSKNDLFISFREKFRWKNELKFYTILYIRYKIVEIIIINIIIRK